MICKNLKSIALAMCFILIFVFMGQEVTASQWESGLKDYKIGDIVQYNNYNYECTISHKSQSDWTPDVAVALWKLKESEDIYEDLSEDEVGSLMKETFENFTEEQKERFISSIEMSGDIELMNYHKQYVDPDYEVVEYTFVAANVYSDLARLGLPSAVLYAINAFMVALPSFGIPTVGQVIAATAAASLVVVLALNWDRVSPHIDAIINYLVSKTKATVSSITDIFTKAQAEAIPKVVVYGKTIVVGNTTYNCSERADDVAVQLKRKEYQHYYPAVLSGGYVWIAPVSINRTTAKAIMMFNSSTTGVMALNSNYAKGLCDAPGIGPAYYHSGHSSGDGYWAHYHGKAKSNAHCWFF